MIFIILTIAFGIFNAKTARTINTNEQNKISYQSGADIVLMEQWESAEEGENDVNNFVSDSTDDDSDTNENDALKIVS